MQRRGLGKGVQGRFHAEKKLKVRFVELMSGVKTFILFV